MHRHHASDHIGTVAFWAGLAALCYLTYRVVEPFLNPLGWAAVIAVVFYPVYERLEQRWGPSRAAAMTTLAATIIVVVPLWMVMTAFVREALDLAGRVQGVDSGSFEGIQGAWNDLLARVPANVRDSVAGLAADGVRRAAVFLASQSGAAIRNTAGFVVDLALALFAVFFLLRDSATIAEVIRRAVPMDAVARERWMAQTRVVVSTSVISAGIVAAVQGLLGGIVFAAVGIDAPVFWGVTMAFFCLLPFGAWVIWLPAAILLAASGHPGRAAIVGGLGLGMVSAVDNVLRPMLLSGGARMNGLLIFVSLIGGMAVFGALGLVLGPVIIATGVSLLTTYTESQAAGKTG